MRSGAVLGYRGWRIISHGPGQSRLYGPVSSTRWPEDRALHASCRPVGLRNVANRLIRKDVPHETPDHGCMCGIYAFHDFKDAIEGYGNNRQSVVGPALFWGRIELHTMGFKAEFARPLAICEDFKSYEERFGGTKIIGSKLVDEWEEMVESTVARYSIPLLPKDLVEQYALTWASPIGIEYDTEQ